MAAHARCQGRCPRREMGGRHGRSAVRRAKEATILPDPVAARPNGFVIRRRVQSRRLGKTRLARQEPNRRRGSSSGECSAVLRWARFLGRSRRRREGQSRAAPDTRTAPSGPCGVWRRGLVSPRVLRDASRRGPRMPHRLVDSAP